MCKRVMCTECNKPGWVGCGAHIEDVLGDVAKADRCACAEPTKKPSWFKSLIR